MSRCCALWSLDFRDRQVHAWEDVNVQRQAVKDTPTQSSQSTARSDLLHQQRIDQQQIFRRQRAVGLAQAQATDQHVVARLGQVAFGLEQLALCIQHIDVDAHADLVAEFVGIQRALARSFGGFQRLDLALA